MSFYIWRECWEPGLAPSYSFYQKLIINSDIYNVNGGRDSHPDFPNAMVCKCDGQLAPWAKSGAWDPQ